MGAYRAGADAQLDRAMAMQPAIQAFLAQSVEEGCSLEDSVERLHALISPAPS